MVDGVTTMLAIFSSVFFLWLMPENLCDDTDNFLGPIPRELRRPRWSTDDKDKARIFITKQFDYKNLEIEWNNFTANISGEIRNGANVMGVLRGRYYGSKKDRVAVVAAHYDSSPQSPGVADNLSGLAAMFLILNATSKVSKKERIQTTYFVALDYGCHLIIKLSDPTECGSQAFVNWLTTKFAGRTDEQWFIGGVVIDSILNFNEAEESQLGPKSYSEYFENDKEGHKGNFLAVYTIQEHGTQPLTSTFEWAWQETAIAKPLKAHHFAIQEETLKQEDNKYTEWEETDAYAFWSQHSDRGHLPILYVTDTGEYRKFARPCDLECSTLDETQPFDTCYCGRIWMKNVAFFKRSVNALEKTIEMLVKQPLRGFGVMSAFVAVVLADLVILVFAVQLYVEYNRHDKNGATPAKKKSHKH